MSEAGAAIAVGGTAAAVFCPATAVPTVLPEESDETSAGPKTVKAPLDPAEYGVDPLAFL